MTSQTKTFQLSFPLPRSLDTRIYVHLTVRAKSVMIFLTTAATEEVGTPPAMGSFVYALPDKFNPTQPISTPLFSVESSVDLTSRLARLFAKKTGLPVYVGSSLSLSGAGLGGTVEEEMEAFRKVVDVVTEKLQSSLGITNGVAEMTMNSS
ncbi:hypothetical protein N0V82_007952 [Gnomoniopsis sp. IMI 355080]|nr:hypothetical protein N0V82_007952 [Gnomoniopsis sp. IMI 355080]